MQAVVEGVWNWLHTEEALDAPTLQATLAVYAASLAAHGLAIPPSLHVLALDIALQQGHGLQVWCSVAVLMLDSCCSIARHMWSARAAI